MVVQVALRRRLETAGWPETDHTQRPVDRPPRRGGAVGPWELGRLCGHDSPVLPCQAETPSRYRRETSVVGPRVDVGKKFACHAEDDERSTQAASTSDRSLAERANSSVHTGE